MRYSIELRDPIYVKSYGYLSFDENIGRNVETIWIIITKFSVVDAFKNFQIPETASKQTNSKKI